jgi:thiol-disulfide isomerase/thioredoxin
MHDLGVERSGDRRRRARLLAARLLVIAVGTVLWSGTAMPGTPVDPQGPMAPPFSLPDLEGRSRTLAEFLGTKPILLEFMSTDCPHCREMGPVLTRLHKLFGTRVLFLTVAFDRRSARVKSFAQQHDHPWCYLVGDDETARAYALEGVPTFVLLTPHGRIWGVQVGSAPYDAFVRAIEALLANP